MSNSITLTNLRAKVRFLSKYTGQEFSLEQGNAFQQWKLSNASESKVYLRANTKTELADLIDAFREGVAFVEELCAKKGIVINEAKF